MKFLTKFVFILILSLSEFLVGEKLVYSAGFKLFNAGEAIFTSDIDTLNNEPIIFISSTIKTNAFLSKFYNVRDYVRIWCDINDLTLIQIEKEVNEGSYHLDYSAHITKDLQLISDGNSIQLDTKVYDPISAIFMLRNKPLIKDDSYKFTTVENGIIQKVNVKVGDIEILNVPAGKYKTRQIIPVSDDGQPLFKNDGKMKVWYSIDELHLPVQIEQKTNVGTLILKLKEVSQ